MALSVGSLHKRKKSERQKLTGEAARKTLAVEPQKFEFMLHEAVDIPVLVEDGQWDEAAPISQFADDDVDQFAEGFELFKADAEEYLEDTWGAINSKRFGKRDASRNALDSTSSTKAEDRLRTKEMKKKKSKKLAQPSKGPLEEMLDESAEKDDMTTTIAFHVRFCFAKLFTESLKEKT